MLAVTLLLLSTAMLAGTPGVFRGTLVQGPGKEKIDGRWIYVKGRNGLLRRVEISRAKVSYQKSVPNAKREKLPELALKPGTEVRVSAEQDTDGEWRADEVEVLGDDDGADEIYELPPGHPPVDSSRGMNSQT
jgi:hypothetical protein